MAKLPAFQFYPGDWRKDPGVQALNFFDRGVWFEILCLMHESDERGVLLLNGRAMPDDALARLLGLDNQILTTTLTTLLTYGVAHRRQSDGALFNKRMVRDEKVRVVRSEAGKKGGNPALLNQNPTTQDKQNPTTQDNHFPTPSSSSSSSSSSSERRANTKNPPLPPVDNRQNVEIPTELDTEEFRAAWGRWKADRAARRIKAYTPDGERAALKKLAPLGPLGAIETIEHSISNTYQGLFPDRMKVGGRQTLAEQFTTEAQKFLNGHPESNHDS